MKILKESGGFWVLVVLFAGFAFLAIYTQFINDFDTGIQLPGIYVSITCFLGWRLYVHRAIFFDDHNMYLKSYFKKEMEVVPFNDVISFKLCRNMRPGFTYILKYRLHGRWRFNIFNPIQKNISKFKILIGDAPFD